MILYIAQSIDGYIAYTDGGIEFLEQEYLKNNKLKSNLRLDYSSFINDIDMVLLGYNTYSQVKSMGIDDQYPNIESYVITNKHASEIDTTMSGFISFEDFLKLDLKNKNVYLVGGSKLIKSCMEAMLVEEINLFIIPKVLNEGIKLFDNIQSEYDLILSSIDHNDYIVNMNYQVRYKGDR